MFMQHLNGILLDQPTASYLKLAEQYLAEELNVVLEDEKKDELLMDSDNSLSTEQQYHAHMQELEILHFKLYNLLRDPRYHLNSDHHTHVTSLLKTKNKQLTTEIQDIELKRKDQSDASRATILALEAKLKNKNIKK